MTGREVIENSVRRELEGPLLGDVPRGKPLDTSGIISFSDSASARGPWHDALSLEEILTESDPLRRYGVGILFPNSLKTANAEGGDVNLVGVPGLPSDASIVDAPVEAAESIPIADDADADDFDLSDAYSYLPSSMAISFCVSDKELAPLTLRASGAKYERLSVQVADRQRFWWVRRPFTFEASVDLKKVDGLQAPALFDAPSTDGVDVSAAFRVYCRKISTGVATGSRIVTVALVNRSLGSGPAKAMFQCNFEVAAGSGVRFRPYPRPLPPDTDHDEEASLALLYRKRRTYAVGHGCAADWDNGSDAAPSVLKAWTLPSHEVPSMTPDVSVIGEDGVRRKLTVSMYLLALGDARGSQQVHDILLAYESWLQDRIEEAKSLPDEHQRAASSHILKCKEALARMKSGWKLINTDEKVRRSFQLTNRVMLLQQVRSRIPTRKTVADKSGLYSVQGPHPVVTAAENSAYWRPFQIAFLLATVCELADAEHVDRELVDLIFFPTGGGKTEAYLGAAAFTMFSRRIKDPDNSGTAVLMRYTLRLLTAQQFLRAAALLCVMEDLRSERDDLGNEPFSIGIWVGGSSTPNTWKQAKASLARLQSDPRSENPFLLLRCPYCGAKFGRLEGKQRSKPQVAGYVLAGKSEVRFRCPDTECRFSGKRYLPIHVVDEDIYASKPTFTMGTVDKFAMLAWKPEAHSLFGLGPQGTRLLSPPELIIQDELHLISGPLGSMVGLYEPVINQLCSDSRQGKTKHPKIIASTATIRRYEKQVLDLYGRSRTALFPPHGLEESRAFFAEPATTDDGKAAPGRRYLGIMAPSLGSIQTAQVRVAAAALQGRAEIPRGQEDGYWTNLNFFNSLRELGNTVSLLQSDIPDYIKGKSFRDGIDVGNIQYPTNRMELTSRRRSDDIPRAIEELEVTADDPDCIDVCLASNIIEVGVDIDRLSLMTIVGQPKTTAQYIQVSGRVGRRWYERPGLVVTIYGASKPRDRSHYEHFRDYHERLYAEVEPTSLTPFAWPVLRRGLHGAAVALLRQSNPERGVFPFPQQEFDDAISVLRERASLVDPNELGVLDAEASRRRGEGANWNRTAWNGNVLGGDPLQGLMRYAGSAAVAGAKAPIWDVPSSMRNVDAECRLRITNGYDMADGENQ